MQTTTQTNLFDSFKYFEKLLPEVARTGLFSPAAQRYARNSHEYRPTAEVIRRTAETADTISLELLPPEGFPSFVPGQHIDVAVEIYGVRHVRQYSLTGVHGSTGVAAARDGIGAATGVHGGGTLQITVRRQPGGLVSNFIFGTIHRGAKLEISVPRGDFLMPSHDHSAYLFFSVGSGITPVFSMVRALLAQGAWGDIHFFHAAKSADAVIFHDELKRLAAEHENFHPHFFFSEGPGSERGRLSAASSMMLLQNATHPPQSPVYICGSGKFVQSIETDLRELQYSQISAEYYTLPQTTASEGHAVFLRSGVEVKAENNLLEAAEGAGIKAKHGCRRGICHECKAHKRSGTVKNILTGKETSGEENIQLCITQPVGRVEIEL